MIELIRIENSSSIHSLSQKRIKKYVLVWCDKGSVKMEIDGLDFTIPAGHLLTITSGQYHFYKDISTVEII